MTIATNLVDVRVFPVRPEKAMSCGLSVFLPETLSLLSFRCLYRVHLVFKILRRPYNGS